MQHLLKNKKVLISLFGLESLCQISLLRQFFQIEFRTDFYLFK